MQEFVNNDVSLSIASSVIDQLLETALDEVRLKKLDSFVPGFSIRSSYD